MTQQKQEESTFFCENLKIAIVSLFYSTIEWNWIVIYNVIIVF